ncbi:MAG: AraC family transcriptional regulator [Spirochaetaceae bacterium]
MELFDLPLEGNYAKIKPASDYLNQMASLNSDLIDSIHVYNKKNDIVISSRNGLVYRREGQFPMDNLWLDEFLESEEKNIWLPVRTIDKVEPVKVVSFVKLYPAVADRDRSKGIICINIKESAIFDIISRQQGNNENILIMDKRGEIVSEITSKAISSTTIYNLINDNKTKNNFVGNIGNVKSMISSSTIDSNGWKIVNITPVKEFRKNLRTIQLMILLSCIAVILVGLIITRFFSERMYSPLRIVMNRISESGKDKTDISEYTLINNALDTLTNQVNTLENTLIENKPLIKYNFITGLINNTIRSQEELERRLKMMDLSFNKPYYFAVKIILNYSLTLQSSLEDSQAAKYKLIKILENHSTSGISILSSEVSDNEIGTIAGCGDNNTVELKLYIEEIFHQIFSDLSLYPLTVIAAPVKDPLDLHISFEEVSRLQRYSFILPDTKLLAGELIQNRETSARILPKALQEEFSKSIKLNNENLTMGCVDKIINELKNETYAYNYSYSYRKLTDIVTIFSEYVKQMDIFLDGLEGTTIHKQFRRIENIDLFRQWFAILILEAFAYLRNRSQNKNFRAIKDAKKYILENIEDDLYLDNVAEQVSLKAHYFSKLFKEYTGSHFVTFINSHKMEYGANLLLETDLNITTISERLHFSSAAYFIKKFRTQFGTTPNEYRKRKVKFSNL